MASDEASSKRPARCPICGRATEAAFRPFCSARCRDVDLARWLGGKYAIPGALPGADEDGEERAPGEGGEGARKDDDDPA